MFAIFFVSCDTENIITRSYLDQNTKILKDESVNNSQENTISVINKNIDDKEQLEDLQVVSNVVRFKNYQSFDAFLTDFENSKNKFIKKFSEFESKENIYRQFLFELDKVEDNRDLNILLAKYEKEIEIIDNKVDLRDRSDFDFLFSSASKPYFFVGKMIYVFLQNKQYVIIDGDIKTLEKLLNGEILSKNVNSHSFSNHSNPNLRTTNSTCSYLSGFFQISHNNGNRRGNAFCQIGGVWQFTGGTINGEPELKVHWSMKTRGQVEKKVLGFWFGFNSSNELLVHHKGNAIFNGSIMDSYEPNFTVNNYHWYIENLTFISPGPSGFFIPQSQLNLVSASLEERTGRLINPELAGATVRYLCN